MAHRAGFRPLAKVRKRDWLDHDGTRTPGIALMFGPKVLAHMTPDEARAMADKLHDYADQIQQEETS